jgi:tetratricopeptide (TPR) repeat protein
MKKNNQHQKKLQEILVKKKFEDLEPFHNTTAWTALNTDDRNLLASLFILKGEKQFAQGDNGAKKSFELAAQVAPDNAHVYFRIGFAYANQQINITCLKLAEEFLTKALSLDENLMDARLALGKVYNSLGNLNQDARYFNKADQIFEQTLKCLPSLDDEKLAVLNWYWGITWYFLGKHSGEASDYLRALDKLRKAANLGLQEKVFWSTYGDTLTEVAGLLGKNELFIEVIELYRNSIRLSFDFYEGWLKLGCTNQRLFELYEIDDYYNQSSECFRMAAELDDSHFILWLKWAQLLATWGKVHHDEQSLLESFDKFEKADDCEPNHSLIMCSWAQALMHYGAHTENINKIREAKSKILKCLEVDPQLIDGWYYYGVCLIEFGRYFREEEYFLEAIEKFQYGLSLQKSEPLFSYGLALAHFAVGDMHSDVTEIEKAVHFFSIVFEYGHWQPRQFWNDWGVALLKLAELTNEKCHVEEALEKFKIVLGDFLNNPNEQEIDAEWLYNYGCAWDFLGDFNEDIECYEKAITALSKALQMNPKYSHARYNLALAYSHLGEIAMDVECFHKSIENFQILISYDNEDEMGWNDYGLTLIHLAQLIYDPSRPDQSLKMYEVAETKLLHASALGCVQSFYNLACLNSLIANYTLAMHFLERAENAGALPPLDDILQDEWLEGLRNTASFRHYISQFPTKPDTEQGRD